MKKLSGLFRGKIRVKLFLATFAILMCFIALIIFTSYPLMFRAFTYTTYYDLCTIADSIDCYNPSSTGYGFDLYYIAQNNNIDFEICDESGNTVYTSKGTGSALSSSHFPTEETGSDYSKMLGCNDYKLSERYNGFEVKTVTESNSDYFVYSRQLLTGENLHIYSPVSDVEKVAGVAKKIYSALSILIVTLLGAAFLVIISGISKPVEEMNKVTGDMAALNFKKKCKDYGQDEIGELGRSINTLSDTLNETLADLNEKNKQLEKDIELRLKLDNARKSFISNVSHELKTPIAIISGYAEGLREGISDDPEVIKEYCGIIDDESKKMNGLVLELLELSRLESGSAPFRPSYFDLGLKVNSLLDHLSIRTEEKGIRVTNGIPKGLTCYAQEDKIEIVLKNYITNAISHCENDKKITIGYKKSDGRITVTVFNTGNHISEEDLPEIWDSFYRADKAHDRSENRFGLGLSIVKGIMNNHNCACGAKNVDGGVEFNFEVAEKAEYYENKEI